MVVHTVGGNAVIVDEPATLSSSDESVKDMEYANEKVDEDDAPVRPGISREASTSTVVNQTPVCDLSKLEQLDEKDEKHDTAETTERPYFDRGLSAATLNPEFPYDEPMPYRTRTQEIRPDDPEAAGPTIHQVGTGPLEDWNKPWINILKLAAAFLGFSLSGMKDSVMGVLIPELEEYYGYNYLIVSVALLAPFMGYTIASVINDFLHRNFGRRGVCILGPCLQLIFYIVASTRPPFAGFVVSFVFAGMGCGMLDGCWNTMVGSFKNSSQILCILHGFYGIGGIVCPTFATAMLDRGIAWNYIYVVLVGIATFLLCLCLFAFRHDTAQAYHASIARSAAEHGHGGDKQRSAVMDALRNKLVIMLSVTVLLYVGGEVGASSWMTTFMIDVRKGDRNTMGYVTTGYWTGLTLGRLGFSFLNARFSRFLAWLYVFYLSGSILFVVLAWAIPNVYASAVSTAFLGMFLGPIFPTIVGVAVQKLPRRLHVSGISFAATFGGAGAGIIPFFIGIITNSAGAKVIPPVILAFLLAAMIIWFAIIKFC